MKFKLEEYTKEQGMTKLEVYMKEQGIRRVPIIGQVPAAEYINILKQLAEGV